MKTSFVLFFVLLAVSAYCQTDQTAIPWSRIAPRTSICQVDTQTFSNWRDFTGYITPGAPSYDDGKGIRQSLQVLSVSGQSYTTYKASIYAATTDAHSAYATVQYTTTPSGIFTTPVYVDFYFLRQGLTIPQGGFASIAKFSPDGDVPSRYITLDLDSNYMLHLNFVPEQSGATQWIYQNFNNPLPADRWVNITTYIDFSASGGIMAIWQDGLIQSVANVNGGSGYLKQMHLGIVASGSISSGTIYNYNLVTQRVCSQGQTSSTAIPTAPTTRPTTSSPTSPTTMPTTTTTARPTTPSTTQRTPTIPIPPTSTSNPSVGTDRNSANMIKTSVCLIAIIVALYM